MRVFPFIKWPIPASAFAILVAATPVFADFSGRVVGISDGDTIKVMHNGVADKIRLNGIDCPEKTQAFGTRAKVFASDLAFGKDVTVKDHGLPRGVVTVIATSPGPTSAGMRIGTSTV